MKFPAQPQNAHSEWHIRQFLRGHGSGQYDQESVDNHGHRDTDQKSDLVVTGHLIDQRIKQERDHAHDRRADTGQQKGGLYFLTVAQRLSDGMPVQHTYDQGKGHIADDQTIHAPV